VQQSNVHWQNQTFSKSMLAWSLQPFTTVFPLHFDRKNEERECLLFQWGPDIIKDLSGPLGDDDVRMLYGIVEHPTKERVQES
jgi:hypothetical protein